ncbi:regulator of G-protein signaling 10 isoform X2 [Rhineura floridana]|uniref:regulator of G-protein signaling 10 isoform X2 n=1 Tax=Rhineura floridana TaxID=261503 RepID=UPI002AC884D1|nr:regulator of G-protein signaling 10 isoform X2 [Rhineura floridana]
MSTIRECPLLFPAKLKAGQGWYSAATRFGDEGPPPPFLVSAEMRADVTCAKKENAPKAVHKAPPREAGRALAERAPSSRTSSTPRVCNCHREMFTRAVSRLSRKRPPSEINDDSKPSSSHQSLIGTTRWATSLENLLEDPEGVKRFRMQTKANEIYMTFLSSKASFQVNVEGQSRLDESILEEPHPLMFQKLQNQIFNLMKYDSYSRFLKSDAFLKLKQTEEQEENSPDAQTVAKRASRIYNT